jgi:hypothetical protein
VRNLLCRVLEAHGKTEHIACTSRHPMKCTSLARTLGACATLFGCGCQTPKSARASFQILPPQPSPNITRQQDAKPSDAEIKIVYIPPRTKKPLAEPLFPSAVASSVVRREVFVTVIVDDSGRVSSVQRSLADLSVPIQDSEQFFDAIATAASAWEFEPARQVVWQKVSGEQDRYLYAEIVPARFDVRFVFAR